MLYSRAEIWYRFSFTGFRRGFLERVFRQHQAELNKNIWHLKPLAVSRGGRWGRLPPLTQKERKINRRKIQKLKKNSNKHFCSNC